MARARKSRRAGAAVAVTQSIRVDGGQSTDIGADRRVPSARTGKCRSAALTAS